MLTVVKDGHLMALDVMGGKGDMEEDETLTCVAKVKLKQRPEIGNAKGKGKPCDLDNRDLGLDQRTDREPRLPIIVGFPADQVLFSVVFSTLRR